MFLRYEQLKPKYSVFLLGFTVAKATKYVIMMTTSCSAIINVSYGTIILLLRDTLYCQTLYRERYLEDLKLA